MPKTKCTPESGVTQDLSHTTPPTDEGVQPPQNPQFRQYEDLKERFKDIDDKWHTLASSVHSSLNWARWRNRWIVVSLMTPTLTPSCFVTTDFRAALEWYHDPRNEAFCVVRNGRVMVQRKDAAAPRESEGGK